VFGSYLFYLKKGKIRIARWCKYFDLKLFDSDI
jgi:hypothetical protein